MALLDTLRTPSQLKLLDYEAMRTFVIDTIQNVTGENPAGENDWELLESYQTAVCGAGPWEYHGAVGAEEEVLEEVAEEEERRQVGASYGYRCGQGRKFMDPKINTTYDQR